MNMYKAMIIDDESIVRWGIRDLIPWETEGFSLCEDGKDGRDGLKKLLENRPDLVLVDIKMPGIDGIELIRQARKEGFDGRFIILTGYSEFEFAQSAIPLGVEEYLLKPIDEDDLALCVRKIYEKLEKQEGEKRYHSENEDVAREEVLRKILLNAGSQETLKGQMERYRISFGEGVLCVAILTDREISGTEPGRDFADKVNNFLQDTSLYCQKARMDNQVVLISHGLDYKSWGGMLTERNQFLKKKYPTGLLTSVGNNVNKWYDLCYSYEFAKFMLEQEFLLGQYDVLSIQAIEEQQKIAENLPADYYVMLIEVGDLDGIRECVEKYKTFCIKNLMKEMDIKIQILYNLMVIRNSIGKKYDIPEDTIAKRMEELNQAQKLDYVMELYTQIMQDMCKEIESGASDTVIKRMYYYMEKNFHQDLKLENFAKMFNYNTNYLGRIFRKEIGDSFNNLLDTIRITNAKRLLTETDLKVYQISEQVGYKNIDYFYLKFKKYVGISPMEYKKNVSGIQE